uniref:BBSome interacting protein 1 n=2 Tax=Oryctolagus cuniculus TaxID=9986 RepID=A0A5F9D256_RABIT
SNLFDYYDSRSFFQLLQCLFLPPAPPPIFPHPLGLLIPPLQFKLNHRFCGYPVLFTFLLGFHTVDQNLTPGLYPSLSAFSLHPPPCNVPTGINKCTICVIIIVSLKKEKTVSNNSKMAEVKSMFREVLPKQGQLSVEDVTTMVLCKPKLLPLKSLTLEKLEKMQQAAQDTVRQQEMAEKQRQITH